ncbi:hypothetical protein KP509_11G034900 [Ceratopteris richardii]|uniref:Embryonic stem cell-specific 5-hydroxymethylcytosine-binding protein n=1 Tax=Ceratopteris richardii TaxID=49495 RepID=A0A8T2TTE3_CERRI|nr:hypothetical protein KP509_11G034900 [Ceratopteris richardii]
MCGRARCTLRPEDVCSACGFKEPLNNVDVERFRSSYNVSPGSYMPIVRHQVEENSRNPLVHYMKWGLVPSFTKKTDQPDHFRMFNARSESVHEKASFRRLLPKNRCVAVVEGFYEWKKDGPKKQPYYIHFVDGRPLVFAALFDHWTNESGETLYTFTILTTRSSKALSWLHDRMPVILGNQQAVNSWLDEGLPYQSLQAIMQPYELQDLVWYPVTPAMGKMSYDGPDCIKELKVGAEPGKSIAKMFFKHGKPAESGSTRSMKPSLSSEEESEALAKSMMDEKEFKDFLADVKPDEIVSKKRIDEDIKPECRPLTPSEISPGNGHVKFSKISAGVKSDEKIKQKRNKEGLDEDVKSPKKTFLETSPKAKNMPVPANGVDRQKSLLNFFAKH